MYLCTYVIKGSWDPLSKRCSICVTFIPKISNAFHAENYKELASIQVGGLHSIHPTTQQHLVTKAVC